MGTKAIGGANGKSGKVLVVDSQTIGTFEMCVTEWELTENIQEEDTTNSCSGGKREFEYGIRFIDVTLKMDLDLSQHPLDSPPGMTPGSTIPGIVYLTEHLAANAVISSSSFWEIPLGYAKVASCSVSVPAAGRVTYEIHFKSGNYYSPYESIGSGL